MRSKVQVAVISGGVVGASVLYHLTKFGWKDVLLIERAELTSGSTWHAAGGMHTVSAQQVTNSKCTINPKQHLKIYKTEHENTTETHVKILNPTERIQEIASMLSNGEITQKALENAAQLLQEHY